MEHNDHLKQIQDILASMKKKQEEKTEMQQPADFILPKKVKVMTDWQSKQVVEPSPKKAPLSEEEIRQLMMKANIELGTISKRVSALSSIIQDSELAPYLKDTMEELTNQIKDLNEIINHPVDYDKLSEQGKHEFQHFLMKREQLLTKFKKQV